VNHLPLPRGHHEEAILINHLKFIIIFIFIFVRAVGFVRGIYPIIISKANNIRELWPVGIRRQLMIRHEACANIGGDYSTTNSGRTADSRSTIVGTTSRTKIIKAKRKHGGRYDRRLPHREIKHLKPRTSNNMILYHDEVVATAANSSLKWQRTCR